MSSYSSSVGPGVYIPTTSILDVSDINSLDVNSEEFKNLIIRLYQDLNTISLALNLKESGYYIEEEFVTSKLFFPDPTLNSTTQATPVYRQGFRKVFNVGQINAGITNIAHGLTIGTNWTFTSISGSLTNTTTNNYYPLPFISAGAGGNIEIRANATNIVINNTSGQTFTRGVAILEYIKQ